MQRVAGAGRGLRHCQGSGKIGAPAFSHASRHGRMCPTKHAYHCCASSSRDDAQGRSDDSLTVPDAMPVFSTDMDWREARARLVVSSRKGAAADADAPAASQQAPPSTSAPSSSLPHAWAHELPGPERGCLLLAHPQLFRSSQTYFYLSAILLLDHGPDGSFGVILNKPTQYKLSEIKSSASGVLSSFPDNRLYMGGDVGDTAMVVITRRGDIQAAHPVTAGVYNLPVDQARQAVETGLAEPGEFRFFAQYAGWAPGQLASECKAGVWFCAAASPGLALDEGLSRGPTLWHAVLQAMGGDHARVSDIVAGAEASERMQRGGSSGGGSGGGGSGGSGSS